jgi:hypothetical protein
MTEPNSSALEVALKYDGARSNDLLGAILQGSLKSRN